MGLTAEWQRRIRNWRTVLDQLIYRPLGEISLRGFTTLEQLSFQDAISHPFEPMPPGAVWGRQWEYGWFSGLVELPAQAGGERIVLHLETGGDSLVWINRQIAGSIDREHQHITLSRRAAPGEQFEIFAESYAGHGPTPYGGGPVPYGEQPFSEPSGAQATIGCSTFGIWTESLYQLALDAAVLYELREKIDPGSLRQAEIDQALQELTCIVDLEQPYAELLRGAEAGRVHLRPLLDCKNGSRAPLLHAFGHAHLDVAWLWPLQETERKIARTTANQLALMDEYPEYLYLQSQPQLLWMLRQRYPELYRRVKEKHAGGQFLPEGGSWVEPDTNLAGGESLIRQFLLGRRFMHAEFGIDCRLFWEPDAFGYSGALPQILKGCGMDYFATQKLLWVYNGAEPFPFNQFVWEGIDGSQVLAHVFPGYNNETSPAHLIDAWNQRHQKIGVQSMIFPFGWGDGGGGATRDHLEYLRRETDLQGAPRAQIGSPVGYFQEIEARRGSLPRYVGELYYPNHRGTYTSQARTKRLDRKSEYALREAEFWATAAQVRSDYRLPQDVLQSTWRQLLLQQFHDILPGSSIHRVYEQAERDLAEVLRSAQQISAAAVESYTQPAHALAVFNSLPWSRTVLVNLPKGETSALNSAGDQLPSQSYNGQDLVEIALPACGWDSLYLSDSPAPTSPPPGGACLGGQNESGYFLENEHLLAQFSSLGELTSLYDKDSRMHLTAGAGNRFQMFKDVPTLFDAWDLDSMYAQEPVELDGPATLEVISRGPLQAGLRLKRRLHRSELEQEISLRRGSRRLDFKTTVDWRERHKLLKVSFPVNYHAHEALHEIQFGHIQRPNHASRPHDADRFEVCNHKWTALVEARRGAALLNDCKYGIHVAGNSLNLTLLRAPLSPDPQADQGLQHFSYALLTWNSSLADSPLLGEAYDLNCPPSLASGSAGSGWLYRLSAPNIVLEAAKPAEDGSKDIILRLYEAMRTATRCTLEASLPVKAAIETDMLEQSRQELDFRAGQVELSFRAFEIKTLRLIIQ